MVKKERYHFDKGEVKSSIIEFVLGMDGKVSEPEIRKHLEDKFGVIAQGTINRHLHDLLEAGCLEFFPPEKKGFRNSWDITKIKQLKNIRSSFKKIKLNELEKSLSILLKENGYAKLPENGYYMTSLDGFHFYIRLLISASFFDACIETDIETLYKRALGIHMYKNSYETVRIENLLNEDYTAYIKRYPNLEISPRLFASMMEKMAQKKEEISSTEMFMKVWGEKLLGLSKETSNEIHQETMEDDLKIYWGMRRTTFWMWEREFFLKSELFDLLFEHYFFQDLLDGDASDIEIQFAIKTKANDEECKELSKNWCRNNDRECDNDLEYENISEYHAIFDRRVLSDLKQASIVIAEYRLPSFFDKETYKDSEAIFQKLKESYNPRKNSKKEN